jgi:hypothetical protein
MLLLVGCGQRATTADEWISQQAMRNPAAPAAAFVPVPANVLDKARTTEDCNVDRIDGQVAQGMAVDHLGRAVFAGWSGDHLTHTVPTVVEVILTGATGDYWAAGSSGIPRPDVAKAYEVPGYAASGFAAVAAMYGVPIGEYGISLAYRIDSQWVACRTIVRVSVE